MTVADTARVPRVAWLQLGATVVLFAQRGWKEQVEFMQYCSTKWGTFLLSLKSLCETGKGTPYPENVEIG